MPRPPRLPSTRVRAVGGLLVAAAVLAPIAACQSTPPAPSPTIPPVTSPSPAPSTPIAVSADTMATDLRPANIEDPSTERVVGLLLRGLVRYDAKGKAVDEAAASIDTTDNRVYQVRLQPDWTFADGEAVTSRSFVDAWNYAARVESGQYRARAFAPILGYDAVRQRPGTPGAARDLAGLSIVDERTFTITLTQPQPGFADGLGDLAFAPLPRAALADPTAWSRQPIGNGPYRHEGAWPQSPGAGTTIALRPNPRYRGTAAPQNAGIDFHVYDSPRTAYTDFAAGRLDVLDRVPVDRLSTYRTDFGARAVNQPIGVAQSLVFPLERDPWQGRAGVLRRRAVSTAIDRADLTDRVLAQTGLPATDLSAPVVDGYSPDLCTTWCRHDAETATETLAQAGGLAQPLTIAFAADSGDAPLVATMCEAVRTSLRVECTPRPHPTLLALREAVALGKETGPYLETWRMRRPTLAAFLVPRFATGSPDNGSGYSDALVDTRLSTASTAPLTRQASDYQDVEAQILADLPVVPLWSRNAVGATGPDGTQVRTDVFGSPVYAEIRRP